jgi:maltose alpha-D-glucosyltransferase / alpha-amylase
MASKPAIDRRLQRLASAFTPRWLAGQRWYRAKSRRLATVSLVDATAIDGSVGWLLVLEATDAEGSSTRYLVPAVADGPAFREPQDGDGVWRRLAALALEGGEIEGAGGRWLFTPSQTVPQLLPGGLASLAALPERRLGVQQSNTSIAFGERLILKIYRLLEPGINPEVEVNAFLTEVGFRDAPALGGSAAYLVGGETHAAGMIQGLVPSLGDGWSWLLDRLAAQDGPAEALVGIAQIGRLTAALHAALASSPDAPGFPARLATEEERSAWGAGATRQLDDALRVVTDADRPRLSAIAPRIATKLEAMSAGGDARVSRIHGDYHLGQLLRTADGFAVIDFEGEPARTLVERRAPASPLRDVAGMLRSLDYAAHTSSREAAEQAETLGWLSDARAAFLDGYGGISAADLPLLAAFELEKACYEVVYEANNRPDWTWLPLEALERQVLGA